ncbi:hypothetical protein, partial [Streptomyces anulatus]|uniref:hypothetical protein n=1 Tax=Streptomyces anulatus TaxID=1892 RepID=UPI003BF4AFF5
ALRLSGRGGTGRRGLRAARRIPTRPLSHRRPPVRARERRPSESRDQGENEDRGGEDTEPLPVPARPT